MKKKHKLMVLSIDAMFDSDLAFAEKLPNFGRWLSHSSRACGGMRGIYPALTYPSHVTMITGTYPERHGIFHNEVLAPEEKEADWHWYRSEIQVPTLLDAAHDAGYSTACLGWPCMGADPAADWNIPEIWPKRGKNNLDEILQKSASASVLGDRGVLTRYRHIYEKLGRFFVDEAMVSCACDLIREEQPDVMCMHVAYLDYVRHGHGLYGPAVEEALMFHDDWFGRLLRTMEQAGTLEETNIALVSDHGHLPVERLFCPNVLLQEAGLIQTDESGRVTDWKAFCNSAALSAQVHLKDPEDTDTRNRVESVLEQILKEDAYGVEAIFTKAEAEREQHLSGNFSYVLEGGSKTAFGNAAAGKSLYQAGEEDYRYVCSSHGHLPYKGPQPLFVMKGPDIRQDVWADRGRLIDEAPTLAALLGTELPTAQGRCMEEFLC